MTARQSQYTRGVGSSRGTSRLIGSLQSVAACIFVGGYFLHSLHDERSQKILLPVGYSEYIALTLLSVLAVLVGAKIRRPLAMVVELLVALGLYQWSVTWNTHSLALSIPGYSRHALLYLIQIIIVVLYAHILFRAPAFIRAWLWISVAFTVLALIGLIAGMLHITPLLVTFADYGGGYRLTGTLSEPSAWAPILPGLIAIAWRRKRYALLVVGVAATALTRSPTVFLTTAIALAIGWFVTGSSSKGRVTLSLALACLSATFILPVTQLLHDVSQDLPSLLGGPVDRLAAGIDFITSSGQVGSNDRASGAFNVWHTLAKSGNSLRGNGLGAADTYFPAVAGYVQAYSLPLTILFDLGLIGLTLLVVFEVRSIAWLRRSDLVYILAPFMVASTINSAEGLQLFKFVILALLLFHARDLTTKNSDVVGSKSGYSQSTAPVRPQA
jgi:hypothetical protein